MPAPRKPEAQSLRRWTGSPRSANRCSTRMGLNKGEAHHALKNALRIGRQGEIRDRTTEGQHYRIAGLNLLTAIIVYWNTRFSAMPSRPGVAKGWIRLTI